MIPFDTPVGAKLRITPYSCAECGCGLAQSPIRSYRHRMTYTFPTRNEHGKLVEITIAIPTSEPEFYCEDCYPRPLTT